MGRINCFKPTKVGLKQTKLELMMHPTYMCMKFQHTSFSQRSIFIKLSLKLVNLT